MGIWHMGASLSVLHVQLGVNFRKMGYFPCRGKTHCALNATHRCVVIHKTRGLRENYIDKKKL
jgi:hypothetical protein